MYKKERVDVENRLPLFFFLFVTSDFIPPTDDDDDQSMNVDGVCTYVLTRFLLL